MREVLQKQKEKMLRSISSESAPLHKQEIGRFQLHRFGQFRKVSGASQQVRINVRKSHMLQRRNPDYVLQCGISVCFQPLALRKTYIPGASPR